MCTALMKLYGFQMSTLLGVITHKLPVMVNVNYDVQNYNPNKNNGIVFVLQYDYVCLFVGTISHKLTDELGGLRGYDHRKNPL